MHSPLRFVMQGRVGSADQYGAGAVRGVVHDSHSEYQERLEIRYVNEVTVCDGQVEQR